MLMCPFCGIHPLFHGQTCGVHDFDHGLYELVLVLARELHDMDHGLLELLGCPRHNVSTAPRYHLCHCEGQLAHT